MWFRRDRPRRKLEILGVLFGIGLFFWFFRGIDLGAVTARLVPIGWHGFLLVLLPAFASGWMESAGWKSVLLRIGTRVQFGTLLRIRFATEAVAQTLPAGVVFGESLKVALLVRRGVELDAALAGIAARKYLLMTSQAVYIALAAVAGAAGLEIASRQISGHGGLAWLLALIGIVIGGAALGGRAVLARGRVGTRLRCWVERFRAHGLRRLAATPDRTAATAPSLTDRRLERFFGLGAREEAAISLSFLVSWLCEAFETFVLLRLLGIPLDFGSALAIEVVLSLSRMIAFVVPGGLGVQDAGYALLLNALGVPNAIESGAAFALLKRAKEACYIAVGYALLAIDLRGGAAPEFAAVPRTEAV